MYVLAFTVTMSLLAWLFTMIASSVITQLFKRIPALYKWGTAINFAVAVLIYMGGWVINGMKSEELEQYLSEAATVAGVGSAAFNVVKNSARAALPGVAVHK